MIRFEEEKKEKEEAEKDFTDAKIQISLLENELTNKVEKAREIEMELKGKMNLKKEKEEECLKNKDEINNLTNKMASTVEDINGLSKLKEEKDEHFNLLKSKKDEFMKDYYLKQNRLKDINESLNSLEKEKTIGM